MVLPRFAATRPAAVMPCATAEDIVAAVSFARRNHHPNLPGRGLPDEAYHLGNTGRLRRIRAACDPAGVFGAHSPASS
jgi:Berberine and berberine like